MIGLDVSAQLRRPGGTLKEGRLVRLAMRVRGKPASSVRRARDPHDLGLERPPGSRPDERSWQIGKKMATYIGGAPPIVERYLDAVSRVPVPHLAFLAKEGVRIVFAPRIVDALASEWAAERRGRELSPREIAEIEASCSQEAGTAAVYDLPIDAIVIPTSYVGPDVERVIVHEIGHALTTRKIWEGASERRDLLAGLPGEIARAVGIVPATGEAPASTRSAVVEVMAEAYVWYVSGREEELPLAVTSELAAMLPVDVRDPTAEDLV
jgi:hypothetical protein